MPETIFTNDQALQAKDVFLSPRVQYSWDEIVMGTMVTFNGNSKKMWAVAPNTVRSFERQNKNCPGALQAFQNYFIENKYTIIEELAKVRTADELHGVEAEVCRDIRPRLQAIVVSDRIRSYNKIRKPVDLYFEHLLAMSNELTKHRTTIVPLLFLPLDSETLGKLFTTDELLQHKLGRNPTYENVQSEDVYLSQRIAQEKADQESQRLGIQFHRIYFDMLWTGRLKSNGRNLFETNFH